MYHGSKEIIDRRQYRTISRDNNEREGTRSSSRVHRSIKLTHTFINETNFDAFEQRSLPYYHRSLLVDTNFRLFIYLYENRERTMLEPNNGYYNVIVVSNVFFLSYLRSIHANISPTIITLLSRSV